MKSVIVKKSNLRLILLALLVVPFLIYSDEDKSPEDILLKNYRPKSIFNVPKTYIEKAKYPIIDVHSHPYAETREQIDLWVKNMDEVGIEKTVILTMAVGDEFDSLYAMYSRYPDRFELWCGFDYAGYDGVGFGPDAIDELERCVKVGAKGVGELGDKGKGLFYCQTKAWGMHLDDDRMDPLLEKCAELKLPVSIHVADPKWMYEKMDSTNDGMMNALEWRLDNQEGILSHEEMIQTLENAVKKHPNTIFLVCHLANCSYDLNILGDMFDKYPNLYADIGARYAETAPIPRYVAKFFERYQGRILYGTDMGYDKEMYRITFRILESSDEHFYEYGQFGYHWPLHGFGLSDNILKKLYRTNALKILKQ